MTEVDAGSWPDFIAGLDLRGPVRELAASSAFIAREGEVLRLSLPESDDHLRAPFLVQQLADALGNRWGTPPQVRFEAAAVAGETLHARNDRARDERQGVAESTFLNDPDVMILLATDAAGEGINLQRAHLMANYDLPWNPVRLAQRIGRIDRLGSPHPHIRVATFVPDRGIDDLLGLMQRIRRKLRHIRIVGGDAPWSLAGRRRAARVVDEIDTAGDARERAYALWRSCSAHARPDAAGTPVAVTYWNGEHSAALCCVRAGGEALLILIPDDAPAQVATGACWIALVETLEAAASDAAAIDATHVEIAGVAARVHAAQQAVRKALRGRRAQPPASRSAADLGSARAIVLRWLAERPGGPTDEELEAADSALRTLGEQRRAGTEIRVGGILRSARSAEATVAALHSLATAASAGSVATPDSADIEPAGVRRSNTLELAGVLLLRSRDPT